MREGSVPQIPPSASPQPGGRLPAPGNLALLQAFLNTHYDLVGNHGADLLATPGDLRCWLVDHGLLAKRASVTRADLDRMLIVREALRALVAVGERPSSDPSRRTDFNEAVTGVCLEPRLSASGMVLTPIGASSIDRALGLLLTIAVRAELDSSWSRLKACPGRHCGWVFYDTSRNNSGRWCSMTVCGGREKARAHYRRQQGH